MNNILVIKHSALGDVVLATAPFAAIRQAHPQAHIVLLTTKPYAKLLEKSGYFDEVWVDARPKLYQLIKLYKLIKKISYAGFDRVYDLQTSSRSSLYFHLLLKKPEWSGIASGASHRHNTIERTSLHTIERQKQQLGIAGINNVPMPCLDWLTADITHFNLPDKYALLVAGGSPHRPEKRLPAASYGEFANYLVGQGITPVLIGTQAEAKVIAEIELICPQAINLLGKTNFAEIAELARNATLAVGNDTGPMHIIAVTKCPVLVLFSDFSNPDLCAPRGDNISVIRKTNLVELDLHELENWAKNVIAKG